MPAGTDKELTADDETEVVLQGKKKVRSKPTMAANTPKEELEPLPRDDGRIIERTTDKTVVKVIVVPDRLVNFVIK